MGTLSLLSVEEGAGKTALCAALGRKLIAQGKRVGFLKPLRIITEKVETSDRDAEFIKQVLGLEEAVAALCPVTMTLGELDAALGERRFLEEIEVAYKAMAQGKDVVLIEGLSGLGVDKKLTQASYEIAEVLNAKVLVVARYSPDFSPAKISEARRGFAARMLGVVINGVPPAMMAQLKGLKALGVLPEERLLTTVSVRELVEGLRGEVLNSPERCDELVENMMVGAMCLDPATTYFALKPNKAVVTRGDRADIQLAALATSTRCLVLSGGIKPIPAVLYCAEEKRVPIIVVAGDTLSTMAGIEELLTQARFHQERKLERFGEILDQHLNFEAIFQGLS